MNPAATLEREIEDIKGEISDLERRLFDLQGDLLEDTDAIKRELRAVALDILETAEYRLGGGDIRTLEIAIAKADLDKDQLGRVKLLAREFLFITL